MQVNTRGYAAIGLDNPKTNANIGAVLRAAGIFGCAMVADLLLMHKPRSNRFRRLCQCISSRWVYAPNRRRSNINERN